MSSLSKYSATYMCVYARHIDINTQIFSDLYVYFYLWLYILIVCNSVQNTKGIYLHGSCLLQTQLSFHLFFQEKKIDGPSRNNK